MRWLSDLKMSHDELFARVLEGSCPGCGRVLERRTVADACDVIRVRETALECGWCVLCEWGWRAFVWRDGDGDGTEQWRPGEHLITVYAEGAILTSATGGGNPESRIVEDL